MLVQAVISDGHSSLTIAPALGGNGSPVELIDVTVRDIDLRAGKSVYAGYVEGFEHLARYFEDLAATWRGWDGERVYESIEGDLRIVATHDGHVHLAVRLWHTSVPNGWSTQTYIHVDAGEQLSRAAEDVASSIRG